MGSTEEELLGEGNSTEGNLDGPLPLRQAYERLQRKSVEEVQAAEKRGLEAGRVQARRELAAEQLATSMGFNAQFGATYLASNTEGEVTEDGMRAFAESLGVPLKSEERSEGERTTEIPEASPETIAAATAFSPGETGAQTPGELKTAAEWLEMYQNPATRAEADRLAREGKVVIKHNIGPSSGTIERNP